MATLIASPRKLDNGQWGAYCAAAKVGDIVTVRTAAGKEWQARVVSVVGGVCTTASMDRAPTAGFVGAGKPRSALRTTRTGCRCGSVEEYSKATDCWTCKHDS